ncbi:GntR family transcriptional regulator [Arthrobacter sp. ISL-28]|uniref:GntR family transcriptional regulator n=1 Tax=Arthrobacter sp. ISL-28 TaxID=2819108 RepID=UPI001BE91A19|nr:GntR family transcriptional regulator [Arthrobacter sp. ISL-28]MBT2519436.1 GntR family transcriptional regulator [Arthrobacter sp. ISL-28]
MSPIDRVDRRLMSGEAYDRIRAAIVTGDLAPGERVKDSELAERMGLSRTPVREALARLADMGLVEAKPGVYTRIATLDKDEVARTLAVLKALDELAVRTGTPNLTKGDLNLMRDLNTEFEAAVARNDVQAALEADERFHSVPVTAAQNPLIARVMDQLHPQIHRILYRKFSTLYGAQNTGGHHRELIEILASGDAEEAAKRSGAHWNELGGLIDQLFANAELTA